MKAFIAIASSFLLCSCADMYVVNSRVGGGHAVATDAKDFGSGVRVVTSNCGVGAYGPRYIYIRPFCVDTAAVRGDVAHSDGEIPIRKALMPVEFAEDLKEQLEKIAPARILKPGESPRTGWLVTGEFTLIDGGNPAARALAGSVGAGQSELVLHVHIRDVRSGVMLYEMELAGGSDLQGRHGTVRASGLGRATHFDLVNAAERIYLTLSTNPYKYGVRSNVVLPE